MRELHYIIDTSTSDIGILATGVGNIGDALRCFALHAESYNQLAQEVHEAFYPDNPDSEARAIEWVKVANGAKLPSAVVLKIDGKTKLSYLPLTGLFVTHN